MRLFFLILLITLSEPIFSHSGQMKTHSLNEIKYEHPACPTIELYDSRQSISRYNTLSLLYAVITSDFYGRGEINKILKEIVRRGTKIMEPLPSKIVPRTSSTGDSIQARANYFLLKMRGGACLEENFEPRGKCGCQTPEYPQASTSIVVSQCEAAELLATHTVDSSIFFGAIEEYEQLNSLFQNIETYDQLGIHNKARPCEVIRLMMQISEWKTAAYQIFKNKITEYKRGEDCPNLAAFELEASRYANQHNGLKLRYYLRQCKG